MKTSYTILYVDDDNDDLSIISEAFEKYTDLRVVQANNGVEALQVLKHMAYKNVLPCLIILDINMPVMDGKQTLSQIKKTEEYRTFR